MNSSSITIDTDGMRKSSSRKRAAQQPPTEQEVSHSQAAEDAVASLTSIVMPFTKAGQAASGNVPHPSDASMNSGGALISASSESNGEPPFKRGKHLEEGKREERNAREKERSFRISRQINELRNLLSSGGVIVPKGTKSSVLTEAANYIRMLQQHQYRSEIDRHQLVQQMQMIGGGNLGPQAATAIRHVSAQNGVWSLGNFGGVPPKSAMTYYQGEKKSNPTVPGGSAPAETKAVIDPNTPAPTKVDDHEYRFIFNSCSVGMAVASMGGAFIDCNSLFCNLSNYSKQEICAMTIFNLTSRADLQHAFDLISQMISPPAEGHPNGTARPCVLRGSMKERDDLGLSVSLIKGDDGIAKCFCITLIKNPASSFDTSRPVPATADNIIQVAPMSQPLKDGTAEGLNSSPAYTTG